MTGLRSLRLRLLLAGAVGVVMAAGLGAWLLGSAVDRVLSRDFDRRLDERFAGLVGLLDRGPDGATRLRREPVDEGYSQVYSGIYWQVGSGTSALRSRSLWDTELAHPATPRGTLARVEAQGPRGQRLRIAAQSVRLPGSEARVPVRVAIDLAPLQAEVGAFRWYAAAAIAALALVLLALLLAQVGYGLRPLARLQAALARVQRGEQDRLGLERLPAEIEPLGREIDALLDQHEQRVARARQTVQDLAHSMKTPLAVLAAEAERPGARIAAVVGEQAAKLQALVERRLAPALAHDARARTAVAPVVESLLALMQRAHVGRGLAIGFTGAAGLTFAGSREDLEEMLGNLLDNACKWARSRVEVAATAVDAWLCLVVEDDGPGLDAEQAALAFERGVRLDEQVPGSGLGLGIVVGIAQGYGGALALARGATGGLKAELRLPMAPLA
ncbi:MAG TPA: sensor histidine kinase [Pseudomonadota bacterium]|nr:sensor histidine kinase [Pseudomonadota bacterium]HRA37372.1 sensor histidine kinase [Pseudomonadota bacterium]